MMHPAEVLAHVDGIGDVVMLPRDGELLKAHARSFLGAIASHENAFGSGVPRLSEQMHELAQANLTTFSVVDPSMQVSAGVTVRDIRRDMPEIINFFRDDHAERGAGSLALDIALAKLMELGATAVSLHVLQTNKGIEAFYASLGFKPSTVIEDTLYGPARRMILQGRIDFLYARQQLRQRYVAHEMLRHTVSASGPERRSA